MKKISIIIPISFLCIIGCNGGNDALISIQPENIIVRSDVKINYEKNKGNFNYFDTDDFEISIVNNNRNIPYISTGKLTTLMNYRLKNADFELKSVNKSTFEYINLYTHHTMNIDFSTNKVTYSSLNGFTSYLRNDIGDDYNDIIDEDIVDVPIEDMTSFDIMHSKIINHKYITTPFVVDLDTYHIQTYYINGIGYLPLKVAIDLCTQTTNSTASMVYTGKRLYTLSTNSYNNYLSDVNEYWNINADYNYLQYCFNEQCLQFYLVYGLAKKRNLGNIIDLAIEEGYKEQATKSLRDFHQFTVDFFKKHLNDGGHSKIYNLGYDSDNIEIYNDIIPVDDYKNIRTSTYTSTSTIDSFLHFYDASGNELTNVTTTNIDDTSWDNVKTILLKFDNFGSFPSDLVLLIKKCIVKASKKHSNIKNLIIDIACNTGGSVPFGTYLLSVLLGEATFANNNQKTNEYCVKTISYDTNLDKVYDNNDNISSLKRYIITSKCSFSCGNYLPYLAQHYSRIKTPDNPIKIIGETSGGGTCCVSGVYANTTGALLRLSSNFVISTYDESTESFNDLDGKVTPDIKINETCDLFKYSNIIKNYLD